MAKQVSPLEVNNFVAGLVSDASPLTFPANASLDEDNMVLNDDGSRQRRLGMDFEDGATFVDTSIALGDDTAHSSFKWENAGGDPDKSLLAVQFGYEVKFFDLDNPIISSQVIHTETFDTSTEGNLYSYAVVDGLLVIATGEKEVNVFEYDSTSESITKTTDVLRIRDLFGVEAVVDAVNLRIGNNVSTRPTNKTDQHIYNLRNQSFGVPRVNGNTETLADPISSFFSTASKYPSNADSVGPYLYSDANDSDDRNTERFFSKDMNSNPLGTGHAATGHFIIDALDRGTSRFEAYQDMESKYSQISISISDLPDDTTPGGATLVTQFSGRVWYAGFSGEVIDGDNKSPRMSSYVLFSTTVEDTTDITRCYQEGDPTSKDEPDILDTDGGFIRIDEAYGIKGLKAIQNSLFVLATNGVWRVTGNEESGFTASGYKVVKVTDRGCRGPKSIIEYEGSITYWGDDGIYLITRNDFGDWISQSLTQGRIQEFYSDIPVKDKLLVQGYYDSYEKKVRWVYTNQIDDVNDVRELIYDVQLNAFYTNTIMTPSGVIYPKVVGIFETNPYRLFQSEQEVVVDLDEVIVNVDDEVIINSSTRDSVTREVAYIAVSNVDTTITYSFCSYKDTTFVDWYSLDDVGVDAPAFLLTGYLSGGDFQRNKSVPSLTTYFRKTESGFTEDGDDFEVINPSSCKVQVQWNWTNSANSKRWGREFQAYRLNRFYMPDDLSDGYDDGETVVYTKNKLRGMGRVISIKFATEPLKDLHLYGWSMLVGINTDV